MEDENPPLTNQELADIFNLIADLLEIKGENIFKVLAYRRAADSLLNLSQPAYDIWKEGKLRELPNIGKAIEDKIGELFTTGNLAFLERLKQEVPVSLVELLQIPGVGKKKVFLFWKALGITTVEELEKAAREGKLRELPGLGAKSEERIIAGIEMLARRSTRIPLGDAWNFAQEIVEYLQKTTSSEKIEVAGSLRRKCDTVGDIDLLATGENSSEVMRAFREHSLVSQVLASGETKSSVEYKNGMHAQLWAHKPQHHGTALQYTTGSKAHNVHLREFARTKGFSLSEYGLTQDDGTEILCATEEEVYQHLGIPWIPPELREDRGEIQAAIKNALPRLIETSDIVADLHTHSAWSDGKASIKEMALAAISHGLKVLAITDHSNSLGIAGGISPEKINEQRMEIKKVQEELGDSILLLQGIEVEILADGRLDFPDEVLAKLDIVIASLHTSLRQPREKITERLLNAITNPHVDIVAHPTGRKIPDRDPADLDLERIFTAAAKYNTALEINAHPSRLDLNDINTRNAIQHGVLISINTDAHQTEGFNVLHFGVATARRGWVEAKNVINTWPATKLLNWLQEK